MERTFETPNQILAAIGKAVNIATQKYFKNGIELEKGAVLNERRIEKHRELYELICHMWSIYPDCMLDIIKRSDSHFNLYFYQRIFLRIIMRHGRVCVIAPRALIY